MNLFVLGLLAGLGGQIVRTLIGLLKAWDTLVWDARSIVRIVVTLILGAIAGILAVIVFPPGPQIESAEVLGYIAAGYAGADFIEGLMTRFVPQWPPTTQQPAQQPQGGEPRVR